MIRFPVLLHSAGPHFAHSSIHHIIIFIFIRLFCHRVAYYSIESFICTILSFYYYNFQFFRLKSIYSRSFKSFGPGNYDIPNWSREKATKTRLNCKVRLKLLSDGIENELRLMLIIAIALPACVSLSVCVQVSANLQFHSIFFIWNLSRGRRRKRREKSAWNAINSYFVALVAFHSIIIIIFSVYISTILLRWRLFCSLLCVFYFYLSLTLLSLSLYLHSFVVGVRPAAANQPASQPKKI